MVYNIDFLIAGLVFLFVILYHFLRQVSLDSENNRRFLWLIIAGIINISFDILCTVLITLARPELASVTEICLTILYLLQILLPHGLLLYVASLFTLKSVSRVLRILFIAVLPAVMGILIVLNHWTHMFFVISADGLYLRGPLYMLMYIVAGMFLLASGICSSINASPLDRHKVQAVWELVLYCSITVLIQSFFNDELLSGFGIALGIAVLFFTLNNPLRNRDALTHAYDISYFHKSCTRHIELREEFHLISLELLYLSRINAVLGNKVGNSILVSAAEVMRSNDRYTHVFRSSGKRILVLVYSNDDYNELYNKIYEFFSLPVNVNGELISCPAIICGIKNAGQLSDSDSLLAYVEYLTRTAGKNISETCRIEGSSSTLSGFYYIKEIESYLSTAVNDDLLDVAYQPVYSTAEHKFTSFEVLSRLSHPTFGSIPPEIFISLAEKSNLISKIGIQQLHRVCRMLKEHPEIIESFSKVKFNLSPAELVTSGHVDKLIGIIKSYGLPTELFQFEITETMATEFSRSLLKATSKFSNVGIGICLDDFGSGYANLNMVMTMPFSVVKLDRSLLKNICVDERVYYLYRSISSSLLHMGFSVVAEGVETSDELKRVTSCGVEFIQGFYYSRPVNADRLLQIVENIPG